MVRLFITTIIIDVAGEGISPMIVVLNRHLVCAVFTVIGCPALLQAQFTDPGTYTNSPVGINQLTLGYAFARANASLDPSLVIQGAQLNLNTGILDYSRNVSFFHRFAWVEATLPIAGLNGSVTGTIVQGSVTGTGDSTYVFGTLLKGGPALSPEEFSTYDPTNTIGMSLNITAPTGLYDGSRILNLGSGRWSFKPEIGVSHPFGPNHNWELDGYANAYFFTDNTTYRGRQILRQEPLTGVEAHLTYSFTDSIWASVDTRYAFRGDTLLDGVDQYSSQQIVTVGSELNVSLTPQHSLLFLFAKAVLYQNAPASTGFAIKYIYTWGKGYN